MRKVHGLSLLALLSTTAAWPMKFSAPINQLKLPIIMSTEQPPAIVYTLPGQITVSALRMCGDGDVAHFASSYPAFDFVPHENKELDVIAGFWVVDESSSDIVPNSENWYPIAYQKISIAEKQGDLAPNGKFLPISHAAVDGTSNVMDLIKSDLVNLHDMAVDSYKSNKSYRIFAGTFACINPDEASELSAEGVGTYSPSPIETVQSLKELRSEVISSMSSVDLPGLIANNKKIKIVLKPENQSNLGLTSAPKPYKFEIGNQGLDLDGPLYNSYKNILQADYPVTATTVEEYISAMESLGWHASIKSGMTGDEIAYCNSQGASSNASSKTYSYETFPMNLSCKNLFGGSALVNSYNNLFRPEALPSITDHKLAQKEFATRFLMAAAYETAQKSLHISAKVARSGCFKKPGQNLIGRIVASYPLNFSFTSTDPKYSIKANTNNHIHPEPLFAISDFNKYFSNDAFAVWGQVTSGQGSSDPATLKTTKGILLPLNNKSELNAHKVQFDSFGVPININLKVRSVGGSCTIYC